MDQNIQFLQDMYQNTKMGEETLNALVKHVKGEELREAVARQMQGYASLNGKAREQLFARRQDPKDVGPITKTMSQTMARLNAINNPAPTHIAEMIIQGSTMGIVNATEDLNKYDTADKKVMDLANEIVHFEQENIDRMKPYL